ncbi:MAG: endolytic transglycosylase MltG [Candidatus Azobacteroides sp.]|nr:endolytic transglycosylase MltG [Candidatus Azobacteroides sp.]
MKQRTTLSKSKSFRRKIVFGMLAIFILITGTIAGTLFIKVVSPAFKTDKITYLCIDEKKDYEALLNQLETESQIKDIRLFDRLASIMKYPQNIKSGRYEIKPQLNYLELIRMLRNGNQTPVKLTFNNIRLKKDFAERVGSQLMFGEELLLNNLNQPEVCQSLGFDTTTVMCMFIPNTYEIYWTISVTQFLDRMKKEYDRFWTADRLKKAHELSLSPVEVSVLASIVEEETADKSEYPIVAGLYINRLRKGMLLQADPTVKFAVGDFELRRILFAHLDIDSPYNTYKNFGLPPGPIRIPSIAGIDAVLNYTHHNYLYMVAKEDFSGRHNFAVTLSEHNRNADKYRQALNRNNIR